MPAREQRDDFDRVFRMCLSIGGAVVIIALIYVLRSVLLPFAVAVMFAYFLNPLVNAFQAKTGSRGWAVVLTLILMFIAMLVATPLVLWMLVTEVGDIVAVLSEQKLWDTISADLRAGIDQLERLMPFKDWEAARERLVAWVQEWVQKDSDHIPKIATNVADKVKAVFEQTIGMAATGIVTVTVAGSVSVVIIVYMVFLMLDFNAFQARWKDQLPPDYRDAIVEFLTEFSEAMRRYFRGQFMVAMICGVMFAVGFWIVGIRLAVALGLFIGLLNMVPYLQALGLFPAILLALLKAFEDGGGVLGPLIGVLVVFALVQVAQDTFLVPKIMGTSTGLRPWVIMLSMFIWGKLLGFLGLVLAIPLSCLGLAYYRRNVLKQHDG